MSDLILGEVPNRVGKVFGRGALLIYFSTPYYQLIEIFCCLSTNYQKICAYAKNFLLDKTVEFNIYRGILSFLITKYIWEVLLSVTKLKKIVTLVKISKQILHTLISQFIFCHL